MKHSTETIDRAVDAQPNDAAFAIVDGPNIAYFSTHDAAKQHSQLLQCQKYTDGSNPFFCGLVRDLHGVMQPPDVGAIAYSC
jgi:hypothetical protein